MARTPNKQADAPVRQTNAGRRAPRQRRSRILFDKIVSTANTLFEQEGYAYVTTNRIAEKANISIGSLYQYFQNRESIALAVYENACAKAALIQKRRTLESLSLPLEISIPKHIEEVFEIFERDRYALLQLINEVPELRRTAQPLSFDRLIWHTSQMFLEQHFTQVSRTTIARKAYVLNKCIMGIVSQYLDERPDFLDRNAVIAEVSQLAQQYIKTLSDRRIAPSPPRRKRRHESAAGDPPGPPGA
jgi:AcrR family transcriptional regulator